MKRKRSGSVGIAGLLLPALLLAGDIKYHSYEELTQRLKSLEKAYPNLIQLQSIGKTLENREIWMVQITNEKKGNPDDKSAFFLCGNIEGDHLIGSEVILGTIQYMLGKYNQDAKVTDLIDNHVSYCVPRVNPDGAEYFFAATRWSQRKNMRPVDEDNDGLIDEDSPEDLNKDGYISQMRVIKPEGTWLPDTADTRLLEKADPEKGLKGMYLLYSEGIDNDRDGEFNEDPAGGVDIDRNFPHAYSYSGKDGGPYMTSETETRALIDFLVEHRNVTLILSYSLYDNLILTPQIKPSGSDRRPEAMEDTENRFSRSQNPETSVNPKDLPYLQEIGKQYRKITDVEPPKNGRTGMKPQGSFFEWAYFQYGVVSCTTPIWCPPEIKSESDTVSITKPKRMKPGTQDEAVSDDLKWLKWIDSTREGRGFIPWKSFQHPDLGEVEIGGFDPYIRCNPPEELLPALVETHARFFVSLGNLFPQLVIPELTIQREADSIYRIKVTLQNQGYLPTALAQGVKARAVKPILITLHGDGMEILAGSRLTFCNTMPGSGGAEKYSWLVKANPGTKGTLTVTSEKAGDIVKTLQFK
jgi:murein tripeptide amidase MpaA